MGKLQVWQCRNPRCREPLPLFSNTKLCPACRLMGRWGLAVGAVLGGMLAEWVRLALS